MVQSILRSESHANRFLFMALVHDFKARLILSVVDVDQRRHPHVLVVDGRESLQVGHFVWEKHEDRLFIVTR